MNILDKYGNNVIITCPLCEAPVIVSGLHPNHHRTCACGHKLPSYKEVNHVTTQSN